MSTTLKCTYCGQINNALVAFCENCGSPLEYSLKIDDSGVQLKNFRIGLSGTGQNIDSRDRFFISDISSLFYKAKHRKIVWVVIKGLTKDITVEYFYGKLLHQILSENVDYQKMLRELYEQVVKEHPDAFSINKEKAGSGLIVSIFDNGQVNVLSVDGGEMCLFQSVGNFKPS